MGGRLTSHETNGAACVVKKARFFCGCGKERQETKKVGWQHEKKPFYRGYPVTLQLRYLLPMALLSRYFSELPVWWDMLVPCRVQIFGGLRSQNPSRQAFF